MDAGLSFKAENKKLKDVLFADKKFRIPRYQRPYAWQIEEVTDFWEDLISVDEPYFLGSFIFNTEFEDRDGFVDIIDGQQRLLTITILCAVLRDIAKKVDPEKAKLYQRKDISVEDRSGEHSFRILPAETLAEFFKENIQRDTSDIFNSKSKSAEELRVKDNYRFLHDKVIRGWDGEASRQSKLEWLEKLRNKLADLIVIKVEVSREEDAYEIFESTNARGLDLSVADLLKNLIFRRIPARQDSDIAKDAWSEITGNIESTNTELRKFIRYFWISKYAFLPEKKLFREVKKTVTNWEQLLDDLVKNSESFSCLLAGVDQDFQDFKHGNKIYDAVFALRLMGVSQCFVLLLSIFRNIEHLGTDPTRIFQLIEKFSFTYSVIGNQPPNRVEKVYSKIAIEIEETLKKGETDKHTSAQIQAIFSRLEASLRGMLPSEEVFAKSFANLSYRNTEESRKLLKYILGKTNSFLSKTDEHRIDYNAVNIEHILPQKPHKEWKLKRTEIRLYVDLLGNLTLLSKRINSRIQNAPLSQKLPEFEKSELAITKQLVEELKATKGQWGEREIRNRQNELAQLAYRNIWAI